MFGSYAINKKKDRAPELSLKFNNDELSIYTAPVKYRKMSLIKYMIAEMSLLNFFRVIVSIVFVLLGLKVFIGIIFYYHYKRYFMNDRLPAFSHKQFLKVDHNYEKAATLVNLVYVHDNEKGIVRLKKGHSFLYVFDSKPLRKEDEIKRIKKLAIPPAWTNVWICPLNNGHIQATGFDLRKRKQYRYHPLWNLLRNETKFHHLVEFGKALPQLRLKLEKDFSEKELSQQKVIATVISLMERTYIRIGNNDYEKMYGSYGLTTLKDKHALIKGDELTFSFKGKKGVHQNITLRNKKLACAVKACRDIPGKELFQYYDASGNRRPIESGMINNYIKESMQGDFSAKDFRTWAGTLHALQSFRSIGEALNDTEVKKNIVLVLDDVSKKLGNTRAVCKKYYVHPGLVKMYEEKKLITYINDLNRIEKHDNISGLTDEENAMLKLLQSSY
jgi:DNA topoisomerase I